MPHALDDRVELRGDDCSRLRRHRAGPGSRRRTASAPGPAACACANLAATSSLVSPWYWRRSECPTRVQRAPTSLTIAAATSPVYAPCACSLTSCAPNADRAAGMRATSSARYGYGGNTATSHAIGDACDDRVHQRSRAGARAVHLPVSGDQFAAHGRRAIDDCGRQSIATSPQRNAESALKTHASASPRAGHRRFLRHRRCVRARVGGARLRSGADRAPR